jgi:hypothetical protein
MVPFKRGFAEWHCAKIRMRSIRMPLGQDVERSSKSFIINQLDGSRRWGEPPRPQGSADFEPAAPASFAIPARDSPLQKVGEFSTDVRSRCNS